MKKILGFATLSLALIFASCQEDEKQKAVLELVSAETVSVSATGGEQTIQVNSNSALTAKSSASWVTVAVKDNNTVTATVAAYDGADARSATVTISNESELTPLNVRINQAAVQFDFNPKDYEFEAEGGSYSFPYTAETTLTAVADEGGEDWLTVNVTASEVVLTAAANEAITPRVSVVEWTIGSAKGEFEVSQKGAEATFEGNFENVEAPTTGIEVVYEYTTNSELLVNSEENWIEVWTEDGKLYINVSANSGDAREGYISWSVKGSDKLNGEITVNQAGSLFYLDTYAMDYDQTEYTSKDTFLTRIRTNGTASDIKRALFTLSGIEGADYQTMLNYTKANGSSMTQYAANFAQAGGYGIISGMSSVPEGGQMAVLVYVKIGTQEELKIGYVQFTNGDQKKNWNTNQLKPVANKSDYYGEYHAAFKVTENTTSDFGFQEVQGNVTITDGEAAITDNGSTVELLKISGLWNTQYNLRVSFNDAMYYYYIDGLIYSVDQDLDVLYLDGEQISDGTLFTLTELSDGQLYETTGALTGGVINDEGYIAFVGQTFDGGLDYVSTWLVEDSGYWTIAKDFVLIPTPRPVDEVTAAAAQAKLAKIKTAMRPVKGDGSYLLRSNYSFTNALNKVNASEKNSNVVFSGNATLHTSL